MRNRVSNWIVTGALVATLGACGGADEPATPDDDGGPAAVAPAAEKTPADTGDPVVVYSGRTKSLLKPLFEQYMESTGRKVEVRYGKTAELTATLLEEGDASPADVFFAQDAGALGALSDQGFFRQLPQNLRDPVPARFRSRKDDWVGVSGRARVVSYSTERLKPEDLPDSILDFTDPKWKGRIGWPPTNGSFQAFVTSLRVQRGDEAAKAWLKGIQANEPTTYPKNTPAVQAIANGEIDVAFVNHYYLCRFVAEHGESFPVRNHYMKTGDVGNLVNVAGAAILKTSKNPGGAEAVVEFLLSAEAQTFFATKTFEYPLRDGVALHALLKPLAEVGHPDVDLNRLSDLQGTLALLREVGILR